MANAQVFFTRANSVSTDPRVERAMRCIHSAGYRCMALGWARERAEMDAPKPDGLDVRRFYFPGRFGGGAANVAGLLAFNVWLLYMHVKGRPRVIHAVDLDTVLPALVARLLLKNRVVYDVADWYADSRKLGPFRGLVHRLERWVCRRADLVVLAHEERLRQVGPGLRSWVVVYNTPEDLGPPDSGRVESREAYFAYVGVLQPDRGIPQIIAAASTAEARVVIAGFGPLAEFCRRRAGDAAGVDFRGRVSHGEALALQRDALAVLALYDPGVWNNRLAAPNKLFEAMMLGRPVITSLGTLAGEIVAREGIGLAVPYGDVHRLAEAMDFLASHPAERRRMGERARALYEKRYSFAEQCRRLREAYLRVVRYFE